MGAKAQPDEPPLGRGEDFFRRLADNVPVYLWVRSADDRNVYINKACADFLGIDADHLGQTTADYMHPDDRERWLASVDQHVRDRLVFSGAFRVRRHDGVYRWALVQGSPQFSAEGEYLGYCGAAFDITDQRQNQQDLLALSEQLINTQEEERARIARELHDDLSQRIASLSIAISSMTKHIPKEATEARAQADRLHQKLSAIGVTIRQISHQLHPEMLEQSGIAAALESYTREFSSLNKIEVRFQADGVFEDVPASEALAIYRIVQEALRNVARHSGAAQAKVVLRRVGGNVFLTVRDAGRGLPDDWQTGLGFVSMRERARLAGGSLEMESSPGEGTELRIQIPVRPGANQR